MEKALIVLAIFIGASILITVLWKFMMHDDDNYEYKELMVRTYMHNNHYQSIDHLLADGWRVKLQSQPVVEFDGEIYIEYILYKRVKKGENDDSK